MSTCYRPINLGSMLVGCGSCLGCKESTQNDWYFRNMLEFKYNCCTAYFVTFTYAPEHLPYCGCLATKTDVPSLNHPQFLAAIKRARTKLPPFRYFGVSEYSPDGRPHYHLITYFQTPLPLQTAVESFSFAWCVPNSVRTVPVPYGNVNVEQLTEGRIDYVTNYVLVKTFSSVFDFLDDDIKPRSFMSRRPGIGDLSLDTNSRSSNLRNFFRDNPFSSTMYFPDGSPMAMPRFFESKLLQPPTIRLRHILGRIAQTDKKPLSSEYLSLVRKKLSTKYYLKSLRRRLDEQ